MVPQLTSHVESIAELCRQFGVKRLDVFGSATRSDFDADRSDIDLVVEFAPSVELTLARYFEFKAALEQVLGRPVDLVELSALRSTRLRRLIERARVPVYATAA